MSPSNPSHPADREIASELRLRSDPPPVMRLSRKVLVALGAAGSTAVVAAVAYAMVDTGHQTSPGELYNLGGPPPEQLTAMPKDYASVPKLGPPLPGDLGRPMLQAQAEALPVPPPPAADLAAGEAVAAARQRRDQERDAARTSRLFATGAQAGPITLVAAPGATPLPGQPDGAVDAFLSSPVDRRTTSPDRLSAPASPYVLQAGAVIPAALVTGIRSDLPGQIVGQVTEDVYDSPTGRFLLVPQGSKLIGAYDSEVAFGQSRVMLAWTRLILPNGKSIVLEKLPAGDAQGYSGLQDRVDRHWGALFGMAALSTVLGIGAELGDDSNDPGAIARALRRGPTGALNQVGQQSVGRGLSIPPTLTIRPGAAVKVMVTRDLVLEPYER